MARISGIDIPREKRVEVALTYIFGIGLPTSQKILAQAGDLLVGQVPDPRVGVHVRLGEDLLAGRQPDPVDVRECDLHALLARDVDARDPCHGYP